MRPCQHLLSAWRSHYVSLDPKTTLASLLLFCACPWTLVVYRRTGEVPNGSWR